MRKIILSVLLSMYVLLGFSTNGALSVQTADGVYTICVDSVRVQLKEVLTVSVTGPSDGNEAPLYKVNIWARMRNCPIGFIDGVKETENGFSVQFSYCTGYYFVQSDIAFMYDKEIRDFVGISYTETFMDRLDPDKPTETHTYRMSDRKLSEFTDETLYEVKEAP